MKQPFFYTCPHSYPQDIVHQLFVISISCIKLQLMVFSLLALENHY